MVKRYTCARVGLLIGLLSLNILSACVHTRQPFIGRDPAIRWDYTQRDYTQRYEQDTGIGDKFKIIVPFTFLILWVTLFPAWIIKMSPNTNSSSGFNRTGLHGEDAFFTKGVRPFMFDPVRRSIPNERLGNSSVIPVKKLNRFQKTLALAVDKFSAGRRTQSNMMP
ncbi:MAG: hypothetical protein NMK33_02230 [Candidatus Cardinium sp.]|uniref:hypothetical protein n=1 Tax=Cardinium endosymbiont of Dermatophagoides farinae TaxID=2597823 RepID=UPI00118346E3|nr:hypothetical protein [Cardinium endosymbiont of Dermatophagoides farinae]TSJ81299.1 hypothetical protein FPG78_04905 [Cardinium endosymbiont of Dermatophagoides farinae]UWW97359.1 MAG: hypothetical protein NMK33_02230 [Candidatus Cardinium sp.]